MYVFKRRLFVALAVAIGLAMPFLAVSSANAAYPASATCASTTKVVRLLADVPSCTAVAECPSESGCVFIGTMSASSDTTVGTAQGRLRLTIVDTGAYSDFFCSASAAILASGAKSGCTVNPPTAFLPGGTRIAATCTFVGKTVSLNAQVNCGSSFTPLG
jgi:hypothetical protein